MSQSKPKAIRKTPEVRAPWVVCLMEAPRGEGRYLIYCDEDRMIRYPSTWLDGALVDPGMYVDVRGYEIEIAQNVRREEVTQRYRHMHAYPRYAYVSGRTIILTDEKIAEILPDVKPAGVIDLHPLVARKVAHKEEVTQQ